MGRMAGVLLAGGMLVPILVLGCADRAFAGAPDPSQARQVFARRTETVTGRAHLIYKPDVTTPPFEGNVTVIEQQTGLVVVDAGGLRASWPRLVIISTAATHTYPGEWIATLKKLDAFDDAVLVPGHGAVQTDHAYVAKVIAALETVRAQVGPLARAGVPLAEVRKRVDLAAMKASFTGQDPWLSFLIDAVFTGDLVFNAYKEARGEPAIQGKG